MKILMTGMSARSVGSTRIRYDFVALSDLFHVALEDLGHEVDRRVVDIDERDTLDRYDRALVLVNWASSLSSMHVHEAGLALARLGNRAILYVDDWRTESLGDDLDHHVRRDHGWVHHTTKFRKDYYARLDARQTDTVREQLLSLIESNGHLRPMIGPFHPWGDPQRHLDVSKVPLAVRLLPIDPSPAVAIPEVMSIRPRTRAWVMATLQNHDRWLARLGNQWPLVRLGGVKKEGGGLRANTKAVVPESQVVQAYAYNRGMLVAPYRNEGSGWWRPRYTFALGVGAAVHAGSEVDRELLGSSFTNDLADVEAATDSELDDLARRQKEQFERHQPTYEEFLDRLDTYVVRGF
jgi:hypothetical protein